MKSKAFLDQLQLGGGATVDSLTIGRLAGVELPLPPLDMQNRIVTKLDQLKAQIDDLRKVKINSIGDTNLLRSSILTAAFAGEI